MMLHSIHSHGQAVFTVPHSVHMIVALQTGFVVMAATLCRSVLVCATAAVLCVSVCFHSHWRWPVGPGTLPLCMLCSAGSSYWCIKNDAWQQLARAIAAIAGLCWWVGFIGCVHLCVLYCSWSFQHNFQSLAYALPRIHMLSHKAVAAGHPACLFEV